MVRVRRLTAVALTGVALAAAGCGGDAAVDRANTYVADINAAQERFAADVERIDRDAQDEARLGAYARAAQRVAVRIREIEPPADVAELHRRLVAGFDDYARETAAAGEAIASGRIGRVLKAQKRILRVTRRQQRMIRRTMAAINRALRES